MIAMDLLMFYFGIQIPEGWETTVTREQSFTHKDGTHEMLQSTIDYILADATLLQHSNIVKFPGSNSDHFPFLLEFPMNNITLDLTPDEGAIHEPKLNFTKFYKKHAEIEDYLQQRMTLRPDWNMKDLGLWWDSIMHHFGLFKQKRSTNISANYPHMAITYARHKIHALKRKLRKTSSPWKAQDLRKQIKKQKIRIQKFHKAGTHSHKNRISFVEANDDQQKRRQYLNQTGCYERFVDKAPKNLEKDGKTLTDPQEIREYVGDYYEHLTQEEQNVPRCPETVRFQNRVSNTIQGKDWPEFIEKDPDDPHELDPIMNAQITTEEIRTALQKQPSYKTPGPDLMPYEVLASAMKICPYEMTLTVNQTFDSGHIPAEFCQGTLVLLLKHGDPQKLDNYRPLTMLTTYWKLIFRILNTRLNKFFQETKVIIPEQHGFRSKHECLQQILHLYDTCKWRKDKQDVTWVAFLDFRKAYDSVWRDGLWWKLAISGVGGKILKLIQNAYKLQTARARTPAGLSRKFLTTLGVRQGCVLSPLLFTIFINDSGAELFRPHEQQEYKRVIQATISFS